MFRFPRGGLKVNTVPCLKPGVDFLSFKIQKVLAGLITGKMVLSGEPVKVSNARAQVKGSFPGAEKAFATDKESFQPF